MKTTDPGTTNSIEKMVHYFVLSARSLGIRAEELLRMVEKESLEQYPPKIKTTRRKSR